MNSCQMKVHSRLYRLLLVANQTDGAERVSPIDKMNAEDRYTKAGNIAGLCVLLTCVMR